MSGPHTIGKNTNECQSKSTIAWHYIFAKLSPSIQQYQ